MKTYLLARLALIATATLLICSITLSIGGYMMFLSDPRQGPFDAYRFRELTNSLLPYIVFTGAFFGAWMFRSRWIRITLLGLYLVIGVYVSTIGFAAWSYTGSIITLVMFPLVLAISTPAFIALLRLKNVERKALQLTATRPTVEGNALIPPCCERSLPGSGS